jgi:hypothetical protein
LGCAWDVVPYCRTLAHVMESSESSSDSTPLDSGSHTLGTLDDGQMGLVLSRLVVMPYTGAESTLELLCIVVAFGGTLTSSRDKIALLLHLDVAFGGL